MTPGALAFLKFMRSISFGAFVGVIVALMLKRYFPSVKLSEDEMVGLGAAAGAFLHRVLDGVMNYILRPICRFSDFYFRLLELRLLGTSLSDTQKKAIIKTLAERHFLGK